MPLVFSSSTNVGKLIAVLNVMVLIVRYRCRKRVYKEVFVLSSKSYNEGFENGRKLIRMNNMKAETAVERILKSTKDEELNTIPFQQWKDTILGEVVNDIEDFLFKTDNSEHKRKILKEYSNELTRLYNHMEEYLADLRE